LFLFRHRAFLARQTAQHVVGPLVDKSRDQMLRDAKCDGIGKDLSLVIQLGKARDEEGYSDRPVEVQANYR
jgi:hypothetical protein